MISKIISSLIELFGKFKLHDKILILICLFLSINLLFSTLKVRDLNDYISQLRDDLKITLDENDTIKTAYKNPSITEKPKAKITFTKGYVSKDEFDKIMSDKDSQIKYANSDIDNYKFLLEQLKIEIDGGKETKPDLSEFLKLRDKVTIEKYPKWNLIGGIDYNIKDKSMGYEIGIGRRFILNTIAGITFNTRNTVSIKIMKGL